jgi:hypothetical protein
MPLLKSQRVQAVLAARSLLVIATVFVLLVQTILFVRTAPIRGVATGDGGVKLWQVQGIVRTGDLNAPLDYPGAVYDSEHQYAPFVQPWAFWRDGKFYTEYTSPFIWAAVPLYILFGHKGLLVLPWLSGMLIVLLAAWLAWRVLPNRWAAFVPLIIGLSSPLPPYSLEFWEHTSGAALIALTLVMLVKATRSARPALWWIAAGAALGLSMTMRAELYVYPIALVIGLLFAPLTRVPTGSDSVQLAPLRWSMRTMAFLALGGLITAGSWWLYEFVTWGSPFGPRLQQNVPVLGGAEMLTRLSDTTGHNYVMLWPQEGDAISVLLVLLFVALSLAVILRVLRRLPAVQSTLGTRFFAIGFWALALDLVCLAVITSWRLTQEIRPNDLLTTLPLVLFLLLPVPSSPSRHAKLDAHTSRIVRFLGVTSAAFVVLVLFVSPFEGGIQWGPRFLLPIVAALAVIVVAHAWQVWNGWPRAGKFGVALVLLVLFMAGTYSTWNGVRMFVEARLGTADLAARIASLPERVVVADVWFIPQGAPYTLSDKLWFVAEDKKSMFNLLQMLRKTTPETGVIYLSSPYWAHIDPQIIMGPRIAAIGDPPDTSQFVTLARYRLLR